jgi:hypothetical protein
MLVTTTPKRSNLLSNAINRGFDLFEKQQEYNYNQCRRKTESCVVDVM